MAFSFLICYLSPIWDEFIHISSGIVPRGRINVHVTACLHTRTWKPDGRWDPYSSVLSTFFNKVSINPKACQFGKSWEPVCAGNLPTPLPKAGTTGGFPQPPGTQVGSRDPNTCPRACILTCDPSPQPQLESEFPCDACL